MGKAFERPVERQLILFEQAVAESIVLSGIKRFAIIDQPSYCYPFWNFLVLRHIVNLRKVLSVELR